MTVRRFTSISACVLLVASASLHGCERPAPERANSACTIAPGTLPAARWKAAPSAPTKDAAAAADRLSIVTPYPRYRWDAKQHAVESVDGSVGFHALVVGPKKHSRARLQVSVLLGYRAVDDATLVVRDERRTSELHRVRGSGFARGVPNAASVAIDIEVPAGTVPHGTWREVQTVIEWGPVDGPSEVVDVRRWTVRAGSNAPGGVSCVDSEQSPVTETERELIQRGGRDTLLYPVDDALRVAVRSKKAETVAWVALVDGVPHASPRFIRGASRERVAARETLDVPVDATTFVAVWSDPFLPEQPAISKFLSSNVAHRRAVGQGRTESDEAVD